jgi:hypothetical protein
LQVGALEHLWLSIASQDGAQGQELVCALAAWLVSLVQEQIAHEQLQIVRHKAELREPHAHSPFQLKPVPYALFSLPAPDLHLLALRPQTSARIPRAARIRAGINADEDLRFPAVSHVFGHELRAQRHLQFYDAGSDRGLIAALEKTHKRCLVRS